jgi:hypothetical protein
LRVAALVLGIVGGVLGLIAGILAITVGGIGQAVNANGAGTVTGLGFLAFVMAVVGLVGGALALSKPRVGALLLLVAGIVGFIAVSAFWLLSGPLMLIGALLAFLGRAPKAAAPAAAVSASAPTGGPQN